MNLMGADPGEVPLPFKGVDLFHDNGGDYLRDPVLTFRR